MSTVAVCDDVGYLRDYSVAVEDAVPAAIRREREYCACELHIAVKRELGCVLAHRSKQLMLDRITAVAQRLRCCATDGEVAGSISAGVIRIFH